MNPKIEELLKQCDEALKNAKQAETPYRPMESERMERISYSLFAIACLERIKLELELSPIRAIEKML